MTTVQGERWFPNEATFADEMPTLWGDWYCDSECGTLRSVLLHRPGPEVEGIGPDNFAQYRFRAPFDAPAARAEQDALADLYRSNGIEVHYVQGQREDRPNAMYLRDLMLMTPEGAIVCRPGIPARRGEERAVAATLANLGVPILKTINGDGYFEGACATWLDRDTVILGHGSRSNDSGCAQVERELRNIGVSNIIHTQIPYGSIHLDGFLNVVDRDTVVAFPWHLAYDTARELLDRGFRILEATDIDEVKGGMALNGIALAPGRIVMPAGNPNTRALLEDAGIEVLELPMDHIMAGWGSMHCQTAFLRRDPIKRG
jgi:N-dimethylarginine dimethylaminohydrolase